MKFNKAKHKVLHWGWDNVWYQCRLGDEWIGNSPAENNLGPLVQEKLDGSQQCACILGCLKSSVASRLKEGILSLYSVLVRPTWRGVYSSGIPKRRRTWTYWRQLRGGPWRWPEGWSTLWPWQAERAEVVQSAEGSRETSQQLFNI